jgi:hypothetical protein
MVSAGPSDCQGQKIRAFLPCFLMQNACMTNACNNNRVTPDGRQDETRGLEYPCGEPPAGGEVR